MSPANEAKDVTKVSVEGASGLFKWEGPADTLSLIAEVSRMVQPASNNGKPAAEPVRRGYRRKTQKPGPVPEEKDIV